MTYGNLLHFRIFVVSYIAVGLNQELNLFCNRNIPKNIQLLNKIPYYVYGSFNPPMMFREKRPIQVYQNSPTHGAEEKICKSWLILT